jgi:hypothetical protein
MLAGGNPEILGIGGRETSQLGLPGTPINHSPRPYREREREAAQLLVRRRGRTSSAAIRLLLQATRTSIPLLQAPPLHPLSDPAPRAPGPQIELDLDLDGCHRLPRTSGPYFPIPFLFLFSRLVCLCASASIRLLAWTAGRMPRCLICYCVLYVGHACTA